MDKKGIYMDRIHFYRTLRKTSIKREKKWPFLIKKNPIINKIKQEYT